MFLLSKRRFKFKTLKKCNLAIKENNIKIAKIRKYNNLGDRYRKFTDPLINACIDFLEVDQNSQNSQKIGTVKAVIKY